MILVYQPLLTLFSALDQCDLIPLAVIADIVHECADQQNAASMSARTLA